MANNQRWQDAQRLEELAGEARVNLLRVVALVAFYANHLLNVYAFSDDPAAAGSFHARASALTLAWAAVAVAVHFFLARRWLPPALKFIDTAADLTLITAMGTFSPEGPRSPLLLLYFLVIASAPLRLSLPLAWFATAGAMLGYVAVLGDFVLSKVGWEAYYAEGGPRLPRAHQLLVLLALGAAGLLAGQAIRQARRLALGYPVRAEPSREAA